MQGVHDVVDDFEDALLATLDLLELLLQDFLVVAGRVRMLDGPKVLDLLTVGAGKRELGPHLLFIVIQAP